jgi:isopenicillin-N epimerase
MQQSLYARGFELPVFPWPKPPKRLIRIAAAHYNEVADFERLAEALRT